MDAMRVKQFVLGHAMGMLLVLALALGGIAALAAWDDARQPEAEPVGIVSAVTAPAPAFDGNMARLAVRQRGADTAAAHQLELRRQFFARKLEQGLR